MALMWLMSTTQSRCCTKYGLVGNIMAERALMRKITKDIARLYRGLSDGELVAVNVLGEPFFDVLGTLIKVSPETGDREEVGKAADINLDMLDDFWTAESLRTAWEDRFERLGDDCFLVPKIPFALGGEFTVENLYCIPIPEAIDLYQVIRDQLTGLKDGDKVQIEIVE